MIAGYSFVKCCVHFCIINRFTDIHAFLLSDATASMMYKTEKNVVAFIFWRLRFSLL